FDLILTDPPYGGMLSRPQSGERKKRTGRLDATPFSPRPKNSANLPPEESCPPLKASPWAPPPGPKSRAHSAASPRILQPTAPHHTLPHPGICEPPSLVPTLRFLGYKIWHDRTVNLYPFGYPHAFVANQLHQFILIFRKRVPRGRRLR